LKIDRKDSESTLEEELSLCADPTLAGENEKQKTQIDLPENKHFL
jgi:hypothetical protein